MSFPKNLVGQTIKGIVVDEKTGECLEFAQVGVLGKAVGCLTDINGQFSLKLGDLVDDTTLIISYIGYQKKLISMKHFKKDLVLKILLVKEIYSLPDATILASKFSKNRKFGYTNTNSKDLVTGWSFDTGNNINYPVGERGTLIKIKKKPALIKSLNFHIANNEYDSVLFRIHLYTIKNGMPHKDLLKENKFLKTSQKEGWAKLSLSDLNLIVEENIIATIEWIKAWKQKELTGEGLDISMGLFGNIYTRNFAHQTNWEKFKAGHLGIYLEVKTN